MRSALVKTAAAIVALAATTVAATTPAWSAPFPSGGADSGRAVDTATSPATAHAPVPGIAVAYTDAQYIGVYELRTGCPTYHFNTSGDSGTILSKAAVAGRIDGHSQHGRLRAWSTVTGAPLWTTAGPVRGVMFSNEFFTVVWVSQSTYEVRATAFPKVYLRWATQSVLPVLSWSLVGRSITIADAGQTAGGQIPPATAVLYELVDVDLAAGHAGVLKLQWNHTLSRDGRQAQGTAPTFSMKPGPAGAATGLMAYIVIEVFELYHQARWVLPRAAPAKKVAFGTMTPVTTNEAAYVQTYGVTTEPNSTIKVWSQPVVPGAPSWSTSIPFRSAASYTTVSLSSVDQLLLITGSFGTQAFDMATQKPLWFENMSQGPPFATMCGPGLFWVSNDLTTQVRSIATGAVVSEAPQLPFNSGVIVDAQLNLTAVLYNRFMVAYPLDPVK